MIDASSHKSQPEHRAIAGLSMGANQTMRIIMNIDQFSAIGAFSARPIILLQSVGWLHILAGNTRWCSINKQFN